MKFYEWFYRQNKWFRWTVAIVFFGSLAYYAISRKVFTESLDITGLMIALVVTIFILVFRLPKMLEAARKAQAKKK